MATSQRDPQKMKVYKWEDRFIGPRCKQIIKREDAQPFVDGVFLANGWLYPPKVEAMSKTATKVLATGGRHRIKMPDEMPAWVLCHEIAHTLTHTVDGKGDGHGADFMGIYLKLLQQVCGLSFFELVYMLKDAKVEYNLAAKPWF